MTRLALIGVESADGVPTASDARSEDHHQPAEHSQQERVPQPGFL